MIDSIDEAAEELRNAELDVAADFGDEGVEAGWSDIVHSVAALCTDDVANELLRRQGLS